MNVSVATVGEREAAFGLLVSHHPPADRDRAAQRYRDVISSGELDPAGLFVSRKFRSELRGVMLVSVMPGAMGLAWPPTAARRPDRIETEDALVAVACGWLKERGVKVCQAFGGDADPTSFAPLERAGFKRLTKIVEMDCPLTDDPLPASHLTFEPFSATNRDAFFAMLLASFEESQDVPEANGSRTEAELLGVYEDSSTDLWHLAISGGEPVGVVLLKSDFEPGVCELVYLGLAPKSRGRGLGSELVSFARTSARNSGHATLVLSVDERNLPAQKIYETQGFQASGARSVFLAHWPPIS